MTKYFDTNPEAVEAAMTETGLKNHGLVHALLERKHTVDEIKAMSAYTRLDEYLRWQGIAGWTSLIVNVAKAAGFKMYEPTVQGPENDEQMTTFLEGVVGAVDADRYAQHSLWADYAEEGARWGRQEGIRYPWVSNNSGLMTCVGRHGDMEVWVSLTTAVVNGHKLLFYYGSGNFVDHGMIEKWMQTNLPETARFGPRGFNHTDADNFCNIFPRVPA